MRTKWPQFSGLWIFFHTSRLDKKADIIYASARENSVFRVLISFETSGLAAASFWLKSTFWSTPKRWQIFLCFDTYREGPNPHFCVLRLFSQPTHDGNFSAPAKDSCTNFLQKIFFGGLLIMITCFWRCSLSQNGCKLTKYFHKSLKFCSFILVWLCFANCYSATRNVACLVPVLLINDRPISAKYL